MDFALDGARAGGCESSNPGTLRSIALSGLTRAAAKSPSAMSRSPSVTRSKSSRNPNGESAAHVASTSWISDTSGERTGCGGVVLEPEPRRQAYGEQRARVNGATAGPCSVTAVQNIRRCATADIVAA